MNNLSMEEWLKEADEWENELHAFTQTVVKYGTLGERERYLFAHACKRTLSCLRAAFDVASERKDWSTSIGQRMDRFGDELLLLLESRLIPGAESREARTEYLVMKGDIFRYLCEVVSDSRVRSVCDQGLASYRMALTLAQSLDANEPARLSAVLNYAVFLKEILARQDEACALVAHHLTFAEESGRALSGPGAVLIELLRKLLHDWSGGMSTSFPRHQSPRRLASQSPLRAREVDSAVSRGPLTFSDSDKRPSLIISGWEDAKKQIVECDEQTDAVTKGIISLRGDDFIQPVRGAIEICMKNSIAARVSAGKLLVSHSQRVQVPSAVVQIAAHMRENAEDATAMTNALINVLKEQFLPSCRDLSTRISILNLIVGLLRLDVLCQVPGSQFEETRLAEANRECQASREAATPLPAGHPGKLTAALYLSLLSNSHTPVSDALDALDEASLPVSPSFANETSLILVKCMALIRRYNAVADRHKIQVAIAECRRRGIEIASQNTSSSLLDDLDPNSGADRDWNWVEDAVEQSRILPSVAPPSESQTLGDNDPIATSAVDRERPNVGNSPNVDPPVSPVPEFGIMLGRGPASTSRSPLEGTRREHFQPPREFSRRVPSPRRMQYPSAMLPEIVSEAVTPRGRLAPSPYGKVVSSLPLPSSRRTIREGLEQPIHAIEEVAVGDAHLVSLAATLRGQQQTLQALQKRQREIQSENAANESLRHNFGGSSAYKGDRVDSNSTFNRLHTDTIPRAPTFPLVFSTAITVTWKSQEGDLFRLARGQPGTGYEVIYEGPATMFYDAGRTPNTVYMYTLAVKLANNDRWSVPSGPASQKTKIAYL